MLLEVRDFIEVKNNTPDKLFKLNENLTILDRDNMIESLKTRQALDKRIIAIEKFLDENRDSDNNYFEIKSELNMLKSLRSGDSCSI